MPTPLPSRPMTNLEPPDVEEVAHLARGVFSAIAPEGGPSELQQLLIAAAFDAMTGVRPSESHEPKGSPTAMRHSGPGSCRR